MVLELDDDMVENDPDDDEDPELSGYLFQEDVQSSPYHLVQSGYPVLPSLLWSYLKEEGEWREGFCSIVD